MFSHNSYPLTFVKTDVDDPAEENEVAFRELEGFKLGPEEVAVLSQEVFEEVGIDRTPTKNGK